MASNGRELLGKHYDKDHLSYEEITRLDLRVVTEDGEEVSYEELRGKIFRIVDRDEPSGYVVRNVETTREATTPCFLQASWRRAAETPKAPGGARWAERAARRTAAGPGLRVEVTGGERATDRYNYREGVGFLER
jgi:hypothetical protein